MNDWNLLFAKIEGLPDTHGLPAPCIALTSCQGRQGVSTLAIQLATAAAERFDVLLVDANATRPRLASLLNVLSSPGLTDVLSEQQEVIDAIHPAPQPGLSVVPWGRAERLSNSAAERFGPCLRTMAADFDLVICDVPALGAGYCDFDWVAAMDQVFLVLEHGVGGTRCPQLAAARLRQRGCPLSGIIVNKRPAAPLWRGSR